MGETKMWQTLYSVGFLEIKFIYYFFVNFRFCILDKNKTKNERKNESIRKQNKKANELKESHESQNEK